MKRIELLLLVSLFVVPSQAKSEGQSGGANQSPGFGITNSLSVTWSYLPTRYPSFDYDIGYYTSSVDGQGLGMDYRILFPLSNSGFGLRTGLGLTYSRIDESGDDSYNVNVAYGRVDLIPPVYVDANWKAQISYCYAYLPIELVYRFEINNALYILPFVGLQAKYNYSFIERYSVESISWYDLFFELFDESVVDHDKSDIKKFIPQAKAGLEIGFKKMFMSFSYSRDMDRMFDEARITTTNRTVGVWGPYTFNCWQLGVGVNF